MDISGDGVTGSVFSGFLKDAFGFSLSYYSGDYAAIGGSSANAFGTAFNPGSAVPATGASLYNGNISSATYAIAPFEYKNVTSAPTGFSGYTYRYDQLNRLTGMDHQTIAPYSGTASWAQDASNLDYREHITYDGNGNIRTYHRNGASTTTQGVNMDKLAYVYNLDANNNLVDNKLRHVYDTVTTSAATTDPQDIINQTNADNYVYDNIGNLKKDIAQNISGIAWNPYGKIDSLKKGDASWINYLYDGSGKRISKIDQTSTANTRTHYVYDASGNVLAVYQYKGTSSTTATEADWLEQHLYGSSRLGTLQPHVAILSTAKLASDAYNSATDQVDQAGNRLYELTNHLGNVMATINDVAITSNRSPLTAIMGANDYYPFGMPMPGRTSVASGSLNYRYGFNGKENNNEAEGVGNQIDYGMRTYDPRVGRFLSVDPLQKKYPELTPYQFADNNPIAGVDLDGKEFMGFGYLVDKLSEGASKLGLKRTAGFISSFGHSAIVDPVYSTNQYIGTIRSGNVFNMVKGVDPTGITSIPDIYKTGKAAVNGNEYAQGQIVGMLPAVYGGFKTAGAIKADIKAASSTPAVEAGTNQQATAANGNAQTQTPNSTFLGGAKGKLYSKQNILEGNHAPTMNSFDIAGFKIKYNKASAFQMIYEDHRSFISTGSTPEAVEFRELEASLLKQGKFMEAFDLNVNHIQEEYGHKYDGAMQQAREYYQNDIVPQLQQQLNAKKVNP